jgi:hypothetical protein
LRIAQIAFEVSSLLDEFEGAIKHGDGHVTF